MAEPKYVDLYLYVAPDDKTLYLIPHVTMEEAKVYAARWFELNELHEYIIATEESTPWVDPAPTIIKKTPEWISLEAEKLELA